MKWPGSIGDKVNRIEEEHREELSKLAPDDFKNRQRLTEHFDARSAPGRPAGQSPGALTREVGYRTTMVPVAVAAFPESSVAVIR